MNPVFVYKRYPRNYWIFLDAACEIAGYFPTATLGLESLARRTGLHHRTLQNIRERLERDGVLQLVEQSEGGRFPKSQRDGAGRANVYAVGPAALNLPLKLPRRTYAKSRRYNPLQPTQNRVGTRGLEPTQNRVATHGVSADKERPESFRRRLEKLEGKGEEEAPKPSSTPTPWCRFCESPVTHHAWWCSTKDDAGRGGQLNAR